jgi:hypothetical protein
MARILIGYELGGGLGHVAGIVDLAIALRAAGHEPVLALRDLRTARPRLEGRGLVFTQAPFVPPPRRADALGFRTYTMGDILKLWGYADPGHLGLFVHAWDTLLRALAPDLVIGEFSPALAVAAHGRIPRATMAVGGFMAPPVERNFRPMRPWQLETPAVSLVHEAAVLDSVNAIQGERGLPSFDCAPALFGGEAVFVCTIPELDPYAAAPGRQAIGAIGLPPCVASRDRPAARSGVFLYLAHDHPCLDVVLAAVAASGLRGCGHVRGGIDPAELERRHPGLRDRLRLLAQPAPLQDVLPGVATVIHHGGHGVALEALRAGTPQLILPQVLEQTLTARAIRRLGAAEVVDGARPAEIDQIVQALRVVARDDVLARAEAVARQLEARWSIDATATIVQGCERIVARAAR